MLTLPLGLARLLPPSSPLIPFVLLWADRKKKNQKMLDKLSKLDKIVSPLSTSMSMSSLLIVFNPSFVLIKLRIIRRHQIN